MEPEYRLILSAVLLAVAQQDHQNVRWLGVRPNRVEFLSRLIAEEACIFVASVAFDEMCEMIDHNADVFRSMKPADALLSYQKLTSDKWSENEKV